MSKISDLWVFPAQIIYVVDGDTVDLKVDHGKKIFSEDRYRLLFCDTPERGQPGYWEAKKYLQSFQAKELLVITTKPDKYGRWLCELYDTMDLSESINKKIIRKKLGVRYGKGI